MCLCIKATANFIFVSPTRSLRRQLICHTELHLHVIKVNQNPRFPLKTIENAIDVPEEICDLVPQKTCKGVYKLVPYLVPEPECKDVPREVCSFGVKGTKLGEKPIVTKVKKN